MISVDAPTGQHYGRPRAWHRLYIQVISEHPADLRGQLEALVQASHDGADRADVDQVKTALFAAGNQTGAHSPATGRTQR